MYIHGYCLSILVVKGFCPNLRLNFGRHFKLMAALICRFMAWQFMDSSSTSSPHHTRPMGLTALIGHKIHTGEKGPFPFECTLGDHPPHTKNVIFQLGL